MNIYKQLIKFYKFLGSNNVPYAGIKDIKFISKVNRRNNSYYFFWFFIPILFIFCIVSFYYLLDESNVSFFISTLIAFLTILLLSSVIRARDGDTIIITNEGVWELTWFHRKFIKWESVDKVVIYTEGKFTSKISVLKVFKWPNIKIKDGNKTIQININYSNTDQIKTFLVERFNERIESCNYEIYGLTVLILLLIIFCYLLIK